MWINKKQQHTFEERLFTSLLVFSFLSTLLPGTCEVASGPSLGPPQSHLFIADLGVIYGFLSSLVNTCQTIHTFESSQDSKNNV